MPGVQQQDVYGRLTQVHAAKIDTCCILWRSCQKLQEQHQPCRAKGVNDRHAWQQQMTRMAAAAAAAAQSVL